METIDELKPIFIELSFADQVGVAVIPGSLEYTLYDHASAEVAIATVSVVPAASDHTVYIPGASNTILNQYNEYEIKILSLKWTYSAIVNGSPVDVEDVAEIIYRVKNLRSLPTPV